MLVLLGIALKSLLIAGSSLGLLTVMKRRSAAERSWVAHIGLLALVLLALAPLVLPSWTVEAPALLGQAPAIQAPTATTATKVAKNDPSVEKALVPATAPQQAAPTSGNSLGTIAAATAIYAVPAAILLFITFIALARLVALRARGACRRTVEEDTDDLAQCRFLGHRIRNHRAVEIAPLGVRASDEALILEPLEHCAHCRPAELIWQRVADIGDENRAALVQDVDDLTFTRRQFAEHS